MRRPDCLQATYPIANNHPLDGDRGLCGGHWRKPLAFALRLEDDGTMAAGPKLALARLGMRADWDTAFRVAVQDPPDRRGSN